VAAAALIDHVLLDGISFMRIALLSDIHGNSTALDAVLNDIATHGGEPA
jgi:hypothetical protein